MLSIQRASLLWFTFFVIGSVSGTTYTQCTAPNETEWAVTYLGRHPYTSYTLFQYQVQVLSQSAPRFIGNPGGACGMPQFQQKHAQITPRAYQLSLSEQTTVVPQVSWFTQARLCRSSQRCAAHPCVGSSTVSCPPKIKLSLPLGC